VIDIIDKKKDRIGESQPFRDGNLSSLPRAGIEPEIVEVVYKKDLISSAMFYGSVCDLTSWHIFSSHPQEV
jgi:hypothetical protein